MRTRAEPRLGVFKFASCDGCQLSLLDCEDELLAVAGAVEIAYFLEATRRPLEGQFDLALVEGSISTPEQMRAESSDVAGDSRFLVTIGACATAGGIQALRNSGPRARNSSASFTRGPSTSQTLATSTPIAEHVPVDFELRGCPINKRTVAGGDCRVPRRSGGRRSPTTRVCVECKRRGIVCVMVAHGAPCLGPVTHAGCGAMCPGYDRGCYGCYGPAETPNTSA